MGSVTRLLAACVRRLARAVPPRRRASPPCQRLLTGEALGRGEELDKRVGELWQAGRYREAQEPARALLALRQRVQGADHWQTADARRQWQTLVRLAALPAEARAELEQALQSNGPEGEAFHLWEQERFVEALPLLRRDLDACRRHLGEDHSQVVAAHLNLAAFLSRAGQDQEAETTYRQALAGCLHGLGEEHPITALTFRRLGKHLYSQAKYAEAEPLQRRAVDLGCRVWGEFDAETAAAYADLALTRYAQGQYAEAELPGRTALRAVRLSLGEGHRETAAAYELLGQIRDAQGDAAEAELLLRKALALGQQGEGFPPLDTARLQQSLGDCLHNQGRYADAEPLCREALAVFRQVLGEDHSATTGACYRLGQNLIAQGQYREAEAVGRPVLEGFRRLNDDDRLETALFAEQLARTLHGQGRYAEAMPFLTQALALRRRCLGEKHPDTGGTYNTIAMVLFAQGKYAEAEPVYRKALEVLGGETDEPRPDLAGIYNNLALILTVQGKDAESETLLRQAMRIVRQVRGEEHPETALTYNNLGMTLNGQGRHPEAEALFRRALEIQVRVLGPDHAETAKTYDNLGENLYAQGRHGEAEALFRRALGVFRRAVGEAHPDTAVCYRYVAAVLVSQGRYAEAEPLLRQSLAIRRQVLGEEHLDTAAAYSELGINLYGQARYPEAEAVWNAAAQSFQVARLRVSFTGLERSAADRSPLPMLAAVLARLGQAAAAWQWLEADLARGLLDALAARVGQPLSPAEKQHRQDLLNRLDQVEKGLMALGPVHALEEAGRAAVQELRRQRHLAYAELAQLEAELADRYGVTAGQVYDFHRIQKALPEEMALLAWVDIPAPPRAADPAGEHWAALLSCRKAPVWVKLPGSGPEGAWTYGDEVLAEQVRQAWEDRPGHRADVGPELARQLYLQRLAPLESVLAGDADRPPIRHLVVLPSPRMAGVPVEGLTERYVVSYAPSGTLFAWLREKRPAAGGDDRPPAAAELLAVGNPVFPPPSERPAAPSPPQSATGITLLAHGPWWTPPSAEQVVRRDPEVQAPAGRMRSAAALPGTRQEVEAIARLFRQLRPRAPADERAEPTLLLGSEASEQRLEELARADRLRAYRFVHLATHAEANTQQPLRSALLLAHDGLPPPLERVLAGQEAHDGRLTAEEMLRTWHLDADLVTLSACETALGKYRGGEGYLGFAQALFLAGAHSLVLSLWPVDDMATALLMTRFYANLLGAREGLSQPLRKADALHEAKQWLRQLTGAEVRQAATCLPETTRGAERQRRPPPGPPEIRPFARPYYWSAFILIGPG
jgi:CHAT domain-containing protein/Tfp pilus assembly protein PilF